MELQGRVVRLLSLKEGVAQSTGNPYKTQEFLFGFYESSDSIYEKNIVLNVRNENIEKYNLKENDKIKVRISLGCREYPQGSGKYFNDIRTGDITIIQKAAGSAQPTNGQQANNNPQPQQNTTQGGENQGGESDDLPF